MGHMSVDVRPRSIRRVGPTQQPMILPMAALIPIIDTNMLLRLACSAARAGYQENLISGLRMTGRANPYVGAHVPGELLEHLPRVALNTRADQMLAEAILWNQVMPQVPVVDLAVRDLLSYRSRQIMSTDGDVDDVETMALAELLAPSVILSHDGVFAKFGHAGAAITAIEHATAVLRAAGIEASYSDGLNALGFTAMVGVHSSAALIQSARRYPLIAAGALAVLAVTAYYRNWYRPTLWKDFGRRVMTGVVEPIVEYAAEQAQNWTSARSGLVIVEPVGEPSLEQRCARHFARCGRSMQPGELRDALAHKDFRVSAAALRRTMQQHPAFVRLPGERFAIGRRLAGLPRQQ